MDHALYGEKKRREHISDYIIDNLAKWHNLIIYLIFTTCLLCADWLPGISKNKEKNPEDFDVRKTWEFQERGIGKWFQVRESLKYVFHTHT